MRRKVKIYTVAATIVTASMLAGCDSQKVTTTGSDNTTQQSSVVETEETELDVVTNLSQIDMTKWQYNEEDQIYYQIGITYCETPVDLTYEKLSVFIPAGYMNAEDNGDGTFTCALNDETMVGNYTAETAPVVIPVETPGYMSCEALTEYTDVTEYTNVGFIYVHAGCRGREEGAPAGVTDLKAAIRYIRYNEGVIAGDMERIFSFGMSGGGAQSALLGSTGDSEMYDAYLEDIGAVQGVSDSVAGSMCWCPITGLDSADEAYEWNMGTTRTDLSEEEQNISDELATAFATYINELGITDEDGNVLTLEESERGIYQAGSYYEYIKYTIETSLNDFLVDTSFPYNSDEAEASGMHGQAGMRNFGDKPDREDLPHGKKPELPEGAVDMTIDETTIEDTDNIARNEISGGVTISGTYETAQDYIDALNADGEWVTYDEATNTATITSIADFAAAVKPASKDLAAFDQLDEGQGENTLFGYADGSGAHFDAIFAEILEGTEYEVAFAEDLATEDAQGNTVDYRLNMYSPLYFLMESNAGYETSTVAKYWRIRSGAWQGDTALTSETNLALALKNYDGVEDVDFATVWGMEHVEAERTGDATTNFITWVNECLAGE